MFLEDAIEILYAFVQSLLQSPRVDQRMVRRGGRRVGIIAVVVVVAVVTVVVVDRQINTLHIT